MTSSLKNAICLIKLSIVNYELSKQNTLLLVRANRFLVRANRLLVRASRLLWSGRIDFFFGQIDSEIGRNVFGRRHHRTKRPQFFIRIKTARTFFALRQRVTRRNGSRSFRIQVDSHTSKSFRRHDLGRFAYIEKVQNTLKKFS